MRVLNLIGNYRLLNRMAMQTKEEGYKANGRYITSDPKLYVLEELKYYKVK